MPTLQPCIHDQVRRTPGRCVMFEMQEENASPTESGGSFDWSIRQDQPCDGAQTWRNRHAHGIRSYVKAAIPETRLDGRRDWHLLVPLGYHMAGNSSFDRGTGPYGAFVWTPCPFAAVVCERVKIYVGQELVAKRKRTSLVVWPVFWGQNRTSERVQEIAKQWWDDARREGPRAR